MRGGWTLLPWVLLHFKCKARERRVVDAVTGSLFKSYRKLSSGVIAYRARDPNPPGVLATLQVYGYYMLLAF